MNTIRTLLHHAIDYAGLFPPASLPLDRALKNFEQYRASGESWMLGRFVVPAARLQELASIANGAVLPLSVLIGANLAADVEHIRSSPLPVDTVEMKIDEISQMEKAMGCIGPRLTAYFETTQTEFIPSIRGAGARAKIRMGGTTPEAIPSADHVVKFLAACAEHKLPFKATAGLHHPLRTVGRLTDPDSGPSAWMFGFLNLFVAAALARRGASHRMLHRVLVEESADAFSFGEEQIRWSGETLSLEELAETRREFAISFGSCSFQEPIAELEALGLL